MMATSPWQTTAVRVFLGAIPWQGIQPSASSAPLDAVPQDWRSQTVRDFFSKICWEADALTFHPPSETVPALSYLMSVQTFFNGFVWQGRPAIGAIPKLSLNLPKPSSLSLDDLSDLF